MSMPKMAETIGVSYASLRHHIEILKSENIICRDGKIVLSTNQIEPNMSQMSQI